MKSNRILVKYKHAVIGKFKDITSVVSPLDDFKDIPEKYFELFSYVHELLMNMIPVSRATINGLFKQKAILYVVNDLPDNKHSKKMIVAGVEIVAVMSQESSLFYFVPSENVDESIFNFGKITALLPIEEIQVEIKEKKLEERILHLI